MNKRLKPIKLLLSVFTVFSLVSIHSAFSADSYEYPELQVTPRSSERLRMEAEKEDEYKWTRHWPIQASALSLMMAGFLQSGSDNVKNFSDAKAKSENDKARLAAFAIGGGWIAGTVLLSTYYRPYATSWEDIKKMPAGSKREQLSKERMAEESLESAASLGKKLRWIAFGTNLGVSAYLLTKAQSGSMAFVADGISILLAATPLLFKYRWETVAHEQEEYKKKIYGPVAGATFFKEQSSGKIVPGLALSLNF